MQGQQIMRKRLSATGTSDKITMVTRNRPKLGGAMLDTSIVVASLPYSDRSEVLYQFTNYHLDLMKQRVNLTMNRLQSDRP
jgi:hypothetical protein